MLWKVIRELLQILKKEIKKRRSMNKYRQYFLVKSIEIAYILIKIYNSVYFFILKNTKSK